MKNIRTAYIWLLALFLFLILISVCYSLKWATLATSLVSVMGAVLCSNILTTDAELSKSKKILWWEKQHDSYKDLIKSNYAVYDAYSDFYTFYKNQDVGNATICLEKFHQAINSLRICYTASLVYINPVINKLQQRIYTHINCIRTLLIENDLVDIKKLEEEKSMLKKNLDILINFIRDEAEQ